MKKRRTFIIIGIIVVLLVGGFFGLRYYRSKSAASTTQSTYKTSPAVKGDLTAFVGATGSVRSNQTAIVTWQTSGTIATIKVQKGAKVASGDILAELDKSTLSQASITAEADLLNAQKNLDTVLQNTETRANAQLALVQAQKALDDAQTNVKSKQYQRASQNTIDIARANLILAQQTLKDAERNFSGVAGIDQTNPIYAAALSTLANARQKRDQAQYNLDFVQGLPDAIDVQEVSAQLDQAKAKLLTAQSNWERVKDGPDPADVAAAQAKVDAAKAALNQIHLSAPFAGTITQVISQEGDVVSPGTKAFQIDDLTRLLVDVQVSEVDVNRVRINQPATLTFDAVSGQTYTGTVTDISSVGTTTSGAVNYTVTVEIGNVDQSIKTGMTAAVNIAVDQLQNVLLVPNRAVRVENNKRVVYVLRNNQPVSTEVTIGSSSDTQSQILSGDIKEGDPIVLNPPTQFRGGPGGAGPAGGPGG